jgi:hypothetical protein
LSYLPKLVHRSFVIGFLLPALLFCAYMDFIFRSGVNLSDMFEQSRLLRYTLSSVVLAILLTAINRPIIRLLEGYGRFNPLKLRLPLVRRHFKRSIAPLYAEAKRVEEARTQDPLAKPTVADFSKKLADAVRAYPDREDLLLPTKFGNVYRAYEVYSRVVYELDAIPAWPRIEMLLPSRVQDQIRDARAPLDFTVNLLLLSLISIVVSLGEDIAWRSGIRVYIYVIPVLLIAYSWFMLPNTAHQWGEVVRSIVDLYRDRLARALGLRLPENPDEERRMWREVSRMMIFRTSSSLTSIREFRGKAKSKGRPSDRSSRGPSEKSQAQPVKID